jgi:hypothetical protein
MQNTDPVQLVLLAIGIVILIYIFLKVSKFFFKVLAFLFVAFVIYYFSTGGSFTELKDGTLTSLADDLKVATIEEVFGDTRLQDLDQLCPESDTTDRCICIVLPVKKELESRLRKRQIRRIDRDPALRMEEIRRSMYNKRRKIRNCLLKKNGQRFVNLMDKVVEEVQTLR